ncbi:MAG: DMT family transporter [Burkholderiaceae bacterium]
MNATALALVLTGAALHATWNYYAKKASGGLLFVWFYGWVSLALATPIALMVDLGDLGSLGPLAWLAITASAVIHVVYSLVLQKGYRVADFSIVYPMARGTGPLFAVLAAVVLLGDRPSATGWTAIAAIVGGIALIAAPARRQTGTARIALGVAWGAATGLCIAGYTVLDAWAVKTLAIAPLLYYLPSLAIRCLLIAPQAFAARHLWRAQWHEHRSAILVVGALSPLAYVLVLHAMQLAPLAYVAPAREVSMLIALLIGARVLREALSPARIAGTALMVGGVSLLALAR